jgi:hypothetical protein
MNHGSRKWIKLRVDPWLSGTMRFTLDHKQRAVWADLLALGGQSRIAGFVDVPEINELKATLDLFEKQERITVEHENGRIIIRLLNWSKYQAEYSKQARYKAKKKQQKEPGYPHGYQKATQGATGGDYQKATSPEVEVEAEEQHSLLRTLWNLRFHVTAFLPKPTPNTGKSSPKSSITTVNN